MPMEHEAGRHDVELERAKALSAVAPEDEQALAILRCVQRCYLGTPTLRSATCFRLLAFPVVAPTSCETPPTRW